MHQHVSKQTLLQNCPNISISVWQSGCFELLTQAAITVFSLFSCVSCNANKSMISDELQPLLTVLSHVSVTPQQATLLNASFCASACLFSFCFFFLSIPSSIYHSLL